MSANNIASSVYNSLDESTIPPKTLETSRETNATGPTASCRDDPNIAYTKTGTKPVSTLQNQHNIQSSKLTCDGEVKSRILEKR